MICSRASTRPCPPPHTRLCVCWVGGLLNGQAHSRVWGSSPSSCPSSHASSSSSDLGLLPSRAALMARTRAALPPRTLSSRASSAANRTPFFSRALIAPWIAVGSTCAPKIQILGISCQEHTQEPGICGFIRAGVNLLRSESQR